MGTKESTLNHNISCTQNNEYRKNKMQKKLLMLGSRKSGKTKLFNKIKQLNGPGFDENERNKFKLYIIKYVIKSVQKILRCIEQNGRKFKSNNIMKQCSEIIQSVYLSDSYEENNNLLTDDWRSILNYIDILYQNKSFQNEILRNASQYFVDESVEYFLKNIQRLSEYKYTPTDNDIINLPQNKCLSISNTQVTVGGTVLNIFAIDINDKKWMHCFDDITMLVFVVSLTSYYDKIYNIEYHEYYDEMYTAKLKQKIALESIEFLIQIIGIDAVELILSYIPEEVQIGKNAMMESIDLFDETIHNKWFDSTYVMLLFNNMDLLRDKMVDDNDNHVRSFMICFPEYNGNVDSFQECSKYISQMFMLKNANNDKQRQIYTHFISDTDHIDHFIQLLFSDVQDCVNQMSLSAGGLL